MTIMKKYGSAGVADKLLDEWKQKCTDLGCPLPELTSRQLAYLRNGLSGLLTRVKLEATGDYPGQKD